MGVRQFIAPACHQTISQRWINYDFLINVYIVSFNEIIFVIKSPTNQSISFGFYFLLLVLWTNACLCIYLLKGTCLWAYTFIVYNSILIYTNQIIKPEIKLFIYLCISEVVYVLCWLRFSLMWNIKFYAYNKHLQMRLVNFIKMFYTTPIWIIKITINEQTFHFTTINNFNIFVP